MFHKIKITKPVGLYIIGSNKYAKNVTKFSYYLKKFYIISLFSNKGKLLSSLVIRIIYLCKIKIKLDIIFFN